MKLPDHLTSAANPGRTPDCPSCAAERSQSRALADLIVEQQDILRAVRRIAEDYAARAGAQIDAVTVAASLWPVLSGFDLACPACATRRIAERRHAEMLLGLAGLARVEA